MPSLVNPPPGESLAQFLDRRENELAARVSALRGQLAPLELAEIQKVKMLIAGNRAMGLPDPPSSALVPHAVTVPHVCDLLRQTNSNALMEGPSSVSPLTGAVFYDVFPTRYEKMTIKELAIQGLIDHFPNGTTTSNLREFIFSGYSRAVAADSLRTQMHRLKAQGILNQNGEIWNLEPRKRGLYAMYNHPSSRAAMKELQDEEDTARSGLAAIVKPHNDDFLE
jgi:hypothetical protein